MRGERDGRRLWRAASKSVYLMPWPGSVWHEEGGEGGEKTGGCAQMTKPARVTEPSECQRIVPLIGRKTPRGPYGKVR